MNHPLTAQLLLFDTVVPVVKTATYLGLKYSANFLWKEHVKCVRGKTRTKDKYRVVYSDHQRLELEKEFHYSRYITIRRKSELASMLGLSERQVKIWFQNRRAKERKQAKKREELIQKTKDPLIHQQANPMSIATLSLYKPMVPYDHENNM
ncbi:homeobox protein CDX-1-like [Stegodyphus dumicola]|uniref:homeobox protein CDX-1-like n=1 Tax=Stegodyphus dumicola TaxID=202533 RepID=UPI0015A7DC4C|nr:homeobox protein CDX-1-like [Stegodyphus dumicola]